MNRMHRKTNTRKLAARWRVDRVTGVTCLSWETVDTGRPVGSKGPEAANV